VRGFGDVLRAFRKANLHHVLGVVSAVRVAVVHLARLRSTPMRRGNSWGHSNCRQKSKIFNAFGVGSFSVRHIVWLGREGIQTARLGIG
jgi:hypothetical protein